MRSSCQRCQPWRTRRPSHASARSARIDRMPGINLTRDETQERAALVDVDSYEVEFGLTTGEETFTSITTIRFGFGEEGGSSWLDLIAPAVGEVVLNGTALDAPTVYDGARIRLEGLQEQNELRVVADAAYMHTGEGLHRFVDPVDGEVYVYTQFEVADARRVFACFEQPDLKATFAFTVTAPAHWEVVSNVPTPEPTVIGDDETAKRWAFEPTPRMSTYITALVAGPYHVVRGEYVGKEKAVPLGLFCRKSLAEHLDADELFDVTSRGFAFFEDVFGLAYPFEKYDQLFVPEFNAGAMENAGCVTHHEDYVFRSHVTDAAYERRAETILHEMAHMWFGDLVTMRWWDDLWLNESFATWASVLAQSEATRWTESWTTFAVSEKLWALRQDQLPSTHPISADIRDLDDVQVNFDGITYAKGASVLKQLVAWVGQDEFLAGVRAYFRTHEYGNTTLADLLGPLSESSGRDLSAWADQWLRTSQVNTLRPVYELSDDGRYSTFAIEQTAVAEHPVLRDHRAAVGLYSDGPDGLTRTARFELDVTGARTEVPELVGSPAADLVLVNDDDLTYAKLRLDERSLRTLREGIGRMPDPLARALCWSAAWDMTRDAELAAREWVQIVLAGVRAETESSVVQALLARVQSALSSYADPTWAPTGWTQLADAALTAMHESEPGSDQQLLWSRTFASAARTDEHAAVLRALLDGSEEVPGLTVDADARWAFLHGLVA